MLEIYRTYDNKVSKYIHEDGSETSIKIINSKQNIFNPLTKKIEQIESDRNKFSIFISSSVGCFMKCKFCHLTLKNSEYIKIEEDSILSNLKEAFLDIVKFKPEITNRFIKLSWMGMGDAINKPTIVKNVTIQFLNWIFENNYSIGLDGVDLSTVIPKMKNDNWIGIFHSLESELQKYKINPVYKMDNVEYTNGYYSHKNIFRLFYSIESAIQESRDKIIPNAMLIKDVIELLKRYEDNKKYTLIFHHLIIEGLNDSNKEIEELINLINNNFRKNELRILRYNLCMEKQMQESQNFTNIVKKISDNIEFLKIQISPGNEVSAACGQFIVKDFIRK